METKDLKGRKIEHKTYGEGIIIDIDDVYVIIDFNGNIKKFQIEFLNQYFHFNDEDTYQLVKELLLKIESERIAKKKAEEAEARAQKEEIERLAREEKERLDAEKKKKKKQQPIHPYIDERRSNGKHAIFLVCQNNNFIIESSNGFIWAPTHVDKGEGEIASHAELEYVRKGDIIFHHFANNIYAISVAKNNCSLQEPVLGHPDAGKIGRYVDLSYHILENPASTSGLKSEKSLYGSMTYGPFTKQGNNKQGFYLSELHDKLAKIFIDAAIAANPSDVTLLTFKKHI